MAALPAGDQSIQGSGEPFSPKVQSRLPWMMHDRPDWSDRSDQSEQADSSDPPARLAAGWRLSQGAPQVYTGMNG
jgi:hypothetical protein